MGEAAQVRRSALKWVVLMVLSDPDDARTRAIQGIWDCDSVRGGTIGVGWADL